jgi:phosphonate transport system substrate-binding protein
MPLSLLFWLILAGLGMQDAGNAPAAPMAPPTVNQGFVRLYIVASQSMFGSLNKDDATATMSIWIKELCDLDHHRCDIRVDIISSVAEIRRRVREQSVDLLVLDTPEYLLLAHEGLVEAVAVSTNRGKLAAYSYLLLTKDAGGAAQIAGLRGKRISIASRDGSNMGLMWLETVLAENKLDRAESFFGSVEFINRASLCVLPLFFGKVDACVVDSGNWETITELNPQILRLKVAARSEPLLEGLMAMPIQPQHPYKSVIVHWILTLHLTAAGAQLGNVFKVGPQATVTLKDFESVAKLLTLYRSLLKPSVDPANVVAGRLNDVKEFR